MTDLLARTETLAVRSLFVLDSVTLLWYFLIRLTEVGLRQGPPIRGGSVDLTVIFDSDRLRTGALTERRRLFCLWGPPCPTVICDSAEAPAGKARRREASAPCPSVICDSDTRFDKLCAAQDERVR